MWLPNPATSHCPFPFRSNLIGVNIDAVQAAFVFRKIHRLSADAFFDAVAESRRQPLPFSPSLKFLFRVPSFRQNGKYEILTNAEYTQAEKEGIVKNEAFVEE